jgi:DNA ligase-1
MNEDLVTLRKFIAEVNTTNSTNEKQEIIKKYPQLKKMFRYVYDEQIQFGVTSKNVVKQGLCDRSNYKDIYELLDALASRELTGHSALGQILGFIKVNGFEDEIYRIIDKDLKTRADTTLINKVFPDCVPTFDVALAKVYQDHEKKVDFKKDGWYASRKLDGLRLIAVVDKKSDTRFFSRKGKEFLTLSKIAEEIKKSGLVDMVLDGELCMVDSQGMESFKGIIKEAKTKDHTIERPLYNVFDILSPDEFFSKSSKRVFSMRYSALTAVFSNHRFNTLTKVIQTKITDPIHFEKIREEGRKHGWEGIVIRKDTGYEGKRSDNLLKVKDFQDGEFKVTKVETGPFRVIENGKEVEIQTLTAVVIDYKGYAVNVGSGFSLDERREFYKDPSLIVGKVINVRYFQESNKNDKGTLSLQFPTFKFLFGEERDE